MARSFDRSAPPGEVRAFGRACFLGAGLDPDLENEAYLSATILAQKIGWVLAYSKAINEITLRCEKRKLAELAEPAEPTVTRKELAEQAEPAEPAELAEPAEPTPFDKIGVKLPKAFLETEVCKNILECYSEIGNAIQEPFGIPTASSNASDASDALIASIWVEDQIRISASYNEAFEKARGGELRAKTCAMFDRALAAGAGFEEEPARWKISTELERACFSETITQCLASEEDHRRDWESEAFREIYASRVGVVLRAVDPFGPGHSATGGEARDRLSSGELTPDEFARLPSAQLSPGVWTEIREDLETRANSKIEVVWSDEYRCPSCGQRQATVREQQKRAADEASTIKCTCICGFRFEA